MSSDNSTLNPDAAYWTFSPVCGGGNDFDGRLGLHIAAIFIILVTSAFGMQINAQSSNANCSGALFPLVSRKFPVLHIPNYAFTFAKFFGSGVIIATAFIHLLASSFAELGDPCLSTFWDVEYPWSAAFSMIAVFSVFLIELFAMRFANVSFATTDPLGHEEKAMSVPVAENPRHMAVDFDSHHHGESPEPIAGLNKVSNAGMDNEFGPDQAPGKEKLDA